MEQFLKFSKILKGDSERTYDTYVPISKISFISSVEESNNLKIYTIDQDKKTDIPVVQLSSITTNELEQLLKYAYEHQDTAIISLESIGITNRIETNVLKSNKKYNYSKPIGLGDQV